MIRENVKKRVAVVLIFILCIGVCLGAQDGRAAEYAGDNPEGVSSSRERLDSGFTEESVSKDYTWYDDEEVVLLLDKNKMDQWGICYELNDVTCRAALISVDMESFGCENGLTDDVAMDVMLKIPDKVIYSQKEYIVDKIYLYDTSTPMKFPRVHLYIGKYITEIRFKDFDFRVTSYVHYDNQRYISERGSLFNLDKTKLYRFCDETYDQNDVYILPESVQDIMEYAFYKARIKEICIHDKIVELRNAVFEKSYIQRIDLNHVTEIGGHTFSGCNSLREVIIREQNVDISVQSFSETPALEYIYIPSGCRIGPHAFSDSGLKVVIMGKGVYIEEYERDEGQIESPSCNFSGCYNLEMVIFPEDMTMLPYGAFWNCYSMESLYIPPQVSTIHEKCFEGSSYCLYNKLSLYGENGSVAENVESEKVHLISLEEHEHKLQKITFFSFDTWAVEGKYCKECGYAEKCQRVELLNDIDKQNLSPGFIPKEKIYPELCVELNNINIDMNGIIYELDRSTMTAAVKGINTEQYLKQGVVVIPGEVKKNGKGYVVDTIKENAFEWAWIIVLPDTVKRLEKQCFSNEVKEVIMGKGVEYIHDEAFAAGGLRNVQFRGENPNFIIENNALYNKDKTKLIRVVSHGANSASEYNVPETVQYISKAAFYYSGFHTSSLIQINIPDRENIKWAYESNYHYDYCFACINYVNEKKEMEELPIRTLDPDSDPIISPVVEQTREPLVSPTGKPTICPTENLATVPPEFSTQKVETPSTVSPNFSSAMSSNTVSPITSVDNTDAERITFCQQELMVTGFRGISTSEGWVKLTWGRNVKAKCYRIYRASSQNGEYKLIKMVNKSRLSYVDKDVRGRKKYFYKITAMGVFENKVLEGGMSSVCLVRISGLCIPKISIKKGKLGKTRYITVILKRYEGKNADIYISLGKQKGFKKLKLVSSKISRYKGKFKIRYMVKKQEIRVKVRTYKKNGKKKVYSRFSRVIRVKV